MNKRLPWFDSLRVFAFLLVVIYHLGKTKLPAGFFGVNLFFALSGFLLTAKVLDRILLSDADFSFPSYLKSRGKRLLPAMVMMLLISTLFLFVGSSDLRVDYFRQLAGVFGFTTNAYEIFSGGSYEAQFVPHIYVHTWTLAMEVHFYLLWGGILYFLIHYSAKRHAKSPEARQEWVRLCIFFLSLVLLIFPTLLLVFGAFQGWPTAFLYFSDLTRMTPFFVGSLVASMTGMSSLAYSTKKWAKGSPLQTLLALFGSLALYILLSFKLGYSAPATYRWGFPLLDALCFLLLFATRMLDLQWQGGEDPRPIRFLSRISYGFYLFHWPIYVVLSSTGLPRPFVLLLTVSMAFFLSWFNHDVWEPLLLQKDGNALHLPFKIAAHRRKSRQVAQWSVLLIFVFMLIQLITAPPILSLESRLWSSSLQQEIDQVKEAGTTVRDQIAREKQAEQQRKEAEALQAKARSEGFSMICDSIALGVRDSILQAFPSSQVNGKVSRFLHEAPDILRAMAKSGHLKEMVIIALGNNVYPSFAKTTEEIISILPSGTRVIFVSPYDSSEPANSDVNKYATYLPSLEEKYPFVTVANWHKVSQEHTDIYDGSDGAHFFARKEGIPLYIQTLTEAIARSYQRPVKK